MTSLLRNSLKALALIAALFWLGVLLHEAGHAASALLFGARLMWVNVLGLDLIPTLAWNPLSGYFGYMRYDSVLTPLQDEIVRLCGSLTTLWIALAAQCALWLGHRPKRFVRLALLTLCFYWLDILTYTLPTLGIPAYLFFGTHIVTEKAEAYLAAVEMGMSSWLFQVITLSLSIALLALTVARWYLLIQADKPTRP